jgi:F-type H+-transporting ATPase subunit delta
MAETSTVARPYAQAVFKLAREQGDLKTWSSMLELAAVVTRDPTMLALIQSPRADAEQLASLFNDICGKGFNDQARNLVRLLAQNKRLTLLPVVAEQYELMRAEAEGVIEAELIAATPVDDAQQKKIIDALKSRLGREVSLTCSTDESLLGGAIIRAGDLVIDGSLRGRLEKLAGALTQ